MMKSNASKVFSVLVVFTFLCTGTIYIISDDNTSASAYEMPEIIVNCNVNEKISKVIYTAIDNVAGGIGSELYDSIPTCNAPGLTLSVPYNGSNVNSGGDAILSGTPTTVGTYTASFSTVIVMGGEMTHPVKIIVSQETPTYTVSFNVGEGTPCQSISAKANESITLPSTTRTGYEFRGWYTSSDRAGSAGDSYTVTSDITLTASWLQIYTYTIDYNANGGNGTMDTVIRTGYWSSGGNTYDMYVKSCEFTNEGYHFIGWKIGDDIYQPGSYVTIQADSSVTAYAQWEQDSDSSSEKITVSFNTDEGTSCEQQTVALGSSVILPSTTKAGYTFDGWYLSSTGSDRVGGSGDPYKPSTSLVLYAHWTQKVQYVITFNSSGGTSCESKVVDSGTTIELPSPTKTNCTFLGWYTSATGGTEVTSPYKVVENITLYAHWSTWVVEIAGPYDEYLFFLKFYLNGELQSNITGNVNWYLDGELVHNGSELRYKLTTTPSVGEHTIKVIATITNSTFGSIEDELAFVATEYGPEPLDPVDPEDDHNTYIMIAAGIIVGIVAIIMIARII